MNFDDSAFASGTHGIDQKAIELVADTIAQAWRSGIAADAATLPALHSQAEAYQVQQRVSALLGWTSPANARRLWKVGGPNAQSTPTAACLPESLSHQSGVKIASVLPGLIGLEPELAFRIADADTTTRQAQVQLDACCVAIEVVASRFRQAQTLSPHLKLADQQMNAALVLAPWRSLPDRPWDEIDCSAGVNRVSLSESSRGHPCGDPRWALSWLAHHAQAFGLPLRAGDVVTTGSWLGMLPVNQAGFYEVRFNGVGTASIQFS